VVEKIVDETVNGHSVHHLIRGPKIDNPVSGQLRVLVALIAVEILTAWEHEVGSNLG
jgi:hypothetical protein